jgi:Mce-associated membrane protein
VTATMRRWRLAGLLALSAVLIVCGVVLLERADHLRTTGPVANRAYVDMSATTEVTGQVTTALNAVLSYDYTRPQVAAAAAKRWLAGDAPAQYRLLFQQLQKLAAGQQLTLVARVVTTGVSFLDSTHANLLVFLDQQSTRASDQKSSVSAAQVQISASKIDGGWRITELRPL